MNKQKYIIVWYGKRLMESYQYLLIFIFIIIIFTKCKQANPETLSMDMKFKG